jgi:hypothetical protein
VVRGAWLFAGCALLSSGLICAIFAKCWGGRPEWLLPFLDESALVVGLMVTVALTWAYRRLALRLGKKWLAWQVSFIGIGLFIVGVAWPTGHALVKAISQDWIPRWALVGGRNGMIEAERFLNNAEPDFFIACAVLGIWGGFVLLRADQALMRLIYVPPRRLRLAPLVFVPGLAASVAALAFFTLHTLEIGREPSIEWHERLMNHQGRVVWDLTGVCIVFPDERAIGRVGTGNWICVYSSDGGGGGGGIPGDPDFHSENYDLKTETNTLKFRKHVILIEERGTRVEVDGVTFFIAGKPKKTITLPATGRPTIREFQRSDARPEEWEK